MANREPITIETVSSLVHWLEDDQAEPRLIDDGEIWFRGHADAKWELKPGALRHDSVDRAPEPDGKPDLQSIAAVDNEIERLNKVFRRRAASLLPTRENLVDLYFLAQHHGLPTRLLDWTANSLAALFFAVSEGAEVDGEVVLAYPNYRLTADDPEPHVRVPLKKAPFLQDHDLVKQTVSYLYGEKDEPPKPSMILPVLPDLRFARMVQQEARFTLHMPGTDAINEKGVLRFPVPSQRKSHIQKALRAMGIDWATLFPDVDHLCRELKAGFGLGL